jgi:hypothetical protein
LPQVVTAFDQFLRMHGQTEILRQAWKPWVVATAAER